MKKLAWLIGLAVVIVFFLVGCSKKDSALSEAGFTDDEQFEKLAQKQKDGLITVADCCRELGISRSTWYDRVRKVG